MCWGAGIVDLDNDGYPDLFMTTGHVDPKIEKKLPQYPNRTPRAVFRNLGQGAFEELIEEAGPGVAAAHCSRGCAFGDFDNDGDTDIIIVNLNEPPSLLRNDLAGKANWIKVKLEGVKSNRSAIGARVVAHYGGKMQAQAVLSQSSFFSCNDPRLHFGMGTSVSADLEIFWPSGQRQSYKGLAANQLVTIREGKGVVRNRGWSKSWRDTPFHARQWFRVPSEEWSERVDPMKCIVQDEHHAPVGRTKAMCWRILACLVWASLALAQDEPGRRIAPVRSLL